MIGDTAPGRITEGQLQAAVEQLARLLGWEVHHHFLGVRSGAGFPDVLAIRPPRVVFAELKVGRNRLTPDQERWRALLLACPGVEYRQWREDDWLGGVVEEALR